MIDQKIIEELPRLSFEDGEIIFDQDDLSTDVYFILEGATKSINYSASGEMAYFRLRQKGDFLGYYSAISGEPRTARMIAVGNTLLAKMPAAQFMSLVTTTPTLSEYMLKLLTGILREETKRLTSLITLNAMQQVCVELLTVGTSNIYALGSREEMAARLGLSRETLSRILSDLERQDAIGLEKRQIVVTKPDFLKLIAEGSL